MSAFICSDFHIATIAHHVGGFLDFEPEATQSFADKLKAINISSVNHRYNEKTRKTKCNTKEHMNLKNTHDIAGLISCWIYQSCEDRTNIDFIAYKIMLESYIDVNKLNPDLTNIWSI